ncbi:FixH family protein [Aquibacillus albus]|uniref:YtkA-like domain-containing protein n=1 Tax=Aquibacillus albus TaxID=1168171 RepID=A0ABS2N5V4_9BACI|nr:FixH family protein [Aquibacillus albus]MBM7573530.1 hypothetical protein [Aquibacillus albus]
MTKPFILLFTFLLLAACGQDNSSPNAEDSEPLATLAVDLQAPESLEVNEKATLQAIVTYGNEEVENAEEVEFEVWMDGEKGDSEMIKASHIGDGVYEIEYTFDSDGIYFVQSHVTAEGLHTMPKAEITVGQPDVVNDTDKNKETEQHDDGDREEDDDQNDSNHSDHHHHGNVSIHLDIPEKLEAHDTQKVSVQLEQDRESLTESNVSLEISHKTEDDGLWIDLEESPNGQYKGEVTFNYTGEYMIIIHVKKDDLHEHKELTVTVE